MRGKFTHSIITKFTLYAIIIPLLFGACKKEQEQQVIYNYVADYEKLTSYNKAFISLIFNGAADKEPAILELKDSIKYAVQVYRLEYKSEYLGEVKNASGIVCVPSAEGIFPMISFQNGTYTAHELAPSENYGGDIFKVVAALASHGYIILIPDYFGFGAANDIVHPYYEKESSNSSIIDMINATHELLDILDIEATYSDNLYLMGYSQGAWATLAALKEIEQNEIGNMEVNAASCGSGAYDLLEVSNYMVSLDTFPNSLYLPYFVYSHQQYGTLEGSLDMYFNEPYASMIPGLFDGTYTRNEINDQLSSSVSDMLTSNVIANFSTGSEFTAMRDELNRNSISRFGVHANLRFYHGSDDIHIPYSESERLVNSFRTLITSNPVELITLENEDHLSGVLPWGVQTIHWFNELESK